MRVKQKGRMRLASLVIGWLRSMASRAKIKYVTPELSKYS